MKYYEMLADMLIATLALLMVFCIYNAINLINGTVIKIHPVFIILEVLFLFVIACSYLIENK